MNLGRLVPPDFNHVEKYALTVPTVAVAEKVHKLPWWHWSHDQGDTGSCVGHSSVMERAICNIEQEEAVLGKNVSRRYDPISLWNAAKAVDDFPDTNPGDNNGTTVRAAYDILRSEGVQRVWSMRLKSNIPVPLREKDWNLGDGVDTNRWATTVDDMRSALLIGPVTIGINWYSDFDNPLKKNSDYFIASRDVNWGFVRGGHAVCLYGVSDSRQAFKMKNSWGRSYPLVWVPYEAMDRLLKEDGEVCLVTDR